MPKPTKSSVCSQPAGQVPRVSLTPEQAPRRLVSLPRAGEFADISKDSVRRMIARGELTAYRAGRLLRVDLDELVEVMRRNAGAAA